MIFSNGTKVQRLHADIMVFPASCLGAENGASFCYILAGHVGFVIMMVAGVSLNVRLMCLVGGF